MLAGESFAAVRAADSGTSGARPAIACATARGFVSQAGQPAGDDRAEAGRQRGTPTFGVRQSPGALFANGQHAFVYQRRHQLDGVERIAATLRVQAGGERVPVVEREHEHGGDQCFHLAPLTAGEA